MLAPAVLFATLLLWTASIGAAPVPSSLPAGRVLDHADLNGDGSQELIVALPDSCDEEGTCLVAVYEPEGSGYRVVLPPSVLWDLTPSSIAPTDAGGSGGTTGGSTVGWSRLAGDSHPLQIGSLARRVRVVPRRRSARLG
jgi:hypothetical protein